MHRGDPGHSISIAQGKIDRAPLARLVGERLAAPRRGERLSTAADEQHLYIAAFDGVTAVDTANDSTRTIVPDDSTAVAVDATNVYWFTGTSLMTMCKP